MNRYLTVSSAAAIYGKHIFPPMWFYRKPPWARDAIRHQSLCLLEDADSSLCETLKSTAPKRAASEAGLIRKG